MKSWLFHILTVLPAIGNAVKLVIGITEATRACVELNDAECNPLTISGSKRGEMASVRCNAAIAFKVYAHALLPSLSDGFARLLELGQPNSSLAFQLLSNMAGSNQVFGNRANRLVLFKLHALNHQKRGYAIVKDQGALQMYFWPSRKYLKHFFIM